ncbi:translation elongation factor Ts [Metamycoplasma hyosynoviae]|uniref:translation elongation factor Ts n=1 Tax=Metamycoplasma hyosynoviae TaxID=29559 RepID=UPI002361FAD6|nr:translation elongation factor Ts [Metamycoplasma hyosynoviae]MDD1371396.1 translation elongation factor Ts [Metamycoplasma hyosynoviae]
MAVDLNKLKELRERTNSGFLDCKNALEETNNDIEKAIKWLQEKGIVKAAKKSSRIAAEGIVRAYTEAQTAILFELNSETDFVAKNELFLNFAAKLEKFLINAKFKTIDDVLKLKIDGLTIEDHCKDLTAKIGEKISLRRVEKYTAKKQEVVSSYTHANNRVATIVLAEGNNAEQLRFLAMHITALNPTYMCVSEIPKEVVKQIEEKISISPKLAGKPEKIQESIKAGMLKKEYNDLGVLEYQPYVVDDSLTVQKFLEQSNLKFQKAIRFELGEGIEKKIVDFAAEVAEQMKQ